jgi:hypothetical protein
MIKIYPLAGDKTAQERSKVTFSSNVQKLHFEAHLFCQTDLLGDKCLIE